MPLRAQGDFGVVGKRATSSGLFVCDKGNLHDRRRSHVICCDSEKGSLVTLLNHTVQTEGATLTTNSLSTKNAKILNLRVHVVNE